MANEVHHRIRHLNRTFTFDEWSEYLNECYKDESKRIRTIIGKYTWNDQDICLNPENWTITAKAGAYGYYATIKWAECGNGVWVFGLDYSTGTGGCGFGVAWADKADTKVWNKGFESEKECKRFALRYALTRIVPFNGNNKMVGRLRALLQEELDKLQKPQYIQLELFA